jgi:K+-transporting ATPase KdpF subunit
VGEGDAGVANVLDLFNFGRGFLFELSGIADVLQLFNGEPSMTVLYWIGGVVSVLLVIYLLVALLFPEKFS